jgi:hypothetical protein
VARHSMALNAFGVGGPSVHPTVETVGFLESFL